MDRIVDIHTHILPGIDDGTNDITESIEVINYLANSGITDIVLTPHYMKDTKYNSDFSTRKELFYKLAQNLDNYSVNLYLGNEVYLSEDVVKLLKDRKISTINNTKYLLIELPLASYLKNFQNILCELNDYGIVPIIAHPERYEFLKKNNERISELLEFNCLLQCNLNSLTGKYGNNAKKTMKWLLKNDLVSFVATDTHRAGNPSDLKKSYQKLKKEVGQDKFIELTQTNPLKVLNNEDIFVDLEYLMKRK